MTPAARAGLASTIAAAIDIVVDNIPFQSDANQRFAPPEQGTWARMHVLDGGQSIAAVGSTQRLWRGPALLYFDAFVPLGSGDGIAVDLCDAVRAALRGYAANGVRVMRFEAGPEGPSEGWFRKQQIVVLDHSERG